MSHDSENPGPIPNPPLNRRQFLGASAWGAAALALGGGALTRFNHATATPATETAAPPTTPDRWDHNLAMAADALAPRGRPAGALGPTDPGDPEEPGALDVTPVPSLDLGGTILHVASTNGCVQIFKGIILLEQEYARKNDPSAANLELWDPQSVSRRVSDLLDRHAPGGHYAALPLASRQRILRALADAHPGTPEREAVLLLFNFLLMGFYSGFPGMLNPDDPRHGWRVVSYPGHFAPPFGAGARNRDAEIALIRRRKRQLQARGASTRELDQLERAVHADWNHYEANENGWRA